MFDSIIDLFYVSRERPLPRMEKKPLAALPAGYRPLLGVHRLLSPQLEKYTGGELRLTVMESLQSQGHLYRKVVLSDKQGRPIEFAMICIIVEALPPLLKDAVLAGMTPLGSILAQYDAAISVTPVAFFSVYPDEEMIKLLALWEADRLLYGRYSLLANQASQPLAYSIEVLADLPVVNKLSIW